MNASNARGGLQLMKIGEKSLPIFTASSDSGEEPRIQAKRKGVSVVEEDSLCFDVVDANSWPRNGGTNIRKRTSCRRDHNTRHDSRK